MLPTDAPLTPDGDTARGWVTDELARAEYGHELSPLTRAIRWILQAVSDALGGGTARPPVAAVLLVLFAIALVIVVVLVIRNPVRLTHRGSSSAVFDGEERSPGEARERADRAAHEGDFDLALVWGFRVLVLVLAGSGVVRDTPGLTAREAVSHAAARYPQVAGELSWAADLFDAVRYGTAHATGGDHTRVLALADSLGQSAPADQSGSPSGPGLSPQVPRPAGGSRR
ncbi:DUF4129 domain-containing protein [Actinomyces sp.]|uniref:DUF4129 domain-containing protein n=1 Tax=Actinomyces sp. TaxID=29317 RepID=UPI00289E8E03|nr:DUF4129 domain-containing protein [Actinomyces sp.]